MNKHLNFFNKGHLSFKLSKTGFHNSFYIGLVLADTYEESVSFYLSLPSIFRLEIEYKSENLPKAKWWKNLLQVDYGRRETSFSFWRDLETVSGGVMFYLNIWEGENDLNNWKGYKKFLNTTDFIYGHYDCKTEILNETDKTVFIPGVGEYDDGYFNLKIKEELYSYTWPRFNKKMAVIRYSVDCESGVPCGFKWGRPDRTYGITFGSNICNSEQEAVEAFIEDIQQSRTKI